MLRENMCLFFVCAVCCDYNDIKQIKNMKNALLPYPPHLSLYVIVLIMSSIFRMDRTVSLANVIALVDTSNGCPHSPPECP